MSAAGPLAAHRLYLMLLITPDELVARPVVLCPKHHHRLIKYFSHVNQRQTTFAVTFETPVYQTYVRTSMQNFLGFAQKTCNITLDSGYNTGQRRALPHLRASIILSS